MEKAQEHTARVYSELNLDAQKEFARGLANRLGLQVKKQPSIAPGALLGYLHSA
ncbi:hypothetical protein [Paenibacillus sp. FSL L8-0463]|uniref:hypothetical protein n=1 Tax=Paenibacillus sp. FSL L8-0463 TaxID=2954687 RepID=UPI00311935FE